MFHVEHNQKRLRTLSKVRSLFALHDAGVRHVGSKIKAKECQRKDTEQKGRKGRKGKTKSKLLTQKNE